MPELFSEVFYYWYYLSYGHSLIHLDLNAAGQIKSLAEWFENNDRDKKFLKEQDWAEEELKKRMSAIKQDKSANNI